MRFFNTQGPVNCREHDGLSPLDRFDLNEILTLIQQKKHFHAPRQTGKTTCLLALMEYLNAQDTPHLVLMAFLHRATPFWRKVDSMMRIIAVDTLIRFHYIPFLKNEFYRFTS